MYASCHSQSEVPLLYLNLHVSTRFHFQSTELCKERLQLDSELFRDDDCGFLSDSERRAVGVGSNVGGADRNLYDCQ